MARGEKTKGNFLQLQDNISDSVLGVYYRTPTTKERQLYINKKSFREGKKLKDNSAANRVNFGKRIITGLRDGDFIRTNEEGNEQPISTDKVSENYYEEWKDWMVEHCSDVLTVLSGRVFEVSVTTYVQDEDDGDDDGDDDDDGDGYGYGDDDGEDLEKE